MSELPKGRPICPPDGGHTPNLAVFAVSASVSLRFVLQEGMSFTGKTVRAILLPMDQLAESQPPRSVHVS